MLETVLWITSGVCFLGVVFGGYAASKNSDGAGPAVVFIGLVLADVAVTAAFILHIVTILAGR